MTAVLPVGFDRHTASTAPAVDLHIAADAAVIPAEAIRHLTIGDRVRILVPGPTGDRAVFVGTADDLEIPAPGPHDVLGEGPLERAIRRLVSEHPTL